MNARRSWAALLLGWLAAVLIWCLALAADVPLNSVAVSVVLVLAALLAAVVCGLALPGGQNPAAELFYGAVLALGLDVWGAALLALWGRLDLPALIGGWWIVTFYVALSAPAYLGGRIARRLWAGWNALRQRRFAWALTHAHLLLFAVPGGGGIALIALFVLYDNLERLLALKPGAAVVQLMEWSFSGIVLVFLAGALLLGFFLPLSALFSYRVTSRLTKRIEVLSYATQALRAGDLEQRLVVEGRDEVATLQENFNAMAADLQAYTRKLEDERQRVAALLQTQHELTAVVSHELRTPAATLLAYLETLRRGDGVRSQAEQRRDLEIVWNEAQRLRAILDDLLALSQAQAERLSLNLQRVDTAAILQSAVSSVAGLAWEPLRIQVVAEVEPAPPAVWADPLRLEQVLLNLLHNALRHTPPGGAILARACSAAGGVRIEVADTGAGIASQDLEHIWEKFYTRSGGTGLGLALVKQLGEAMHGSVGVESRPGQGSVFWIELPAEESATQLRHE